MENEENRKAVEAFLARRHLIPRAREFNAPEGCKSRKYGMTRSECARPSLKQFIACNCSCHELTGLNPAFLIALSAEILGAWALFQWA